MDLPKKLYNTALSYHRLGYAVIPIYGETSPTKFKAAAVKWAGFQRRQPTLTELQNWFLHQQHGGLAIVCGDVSGLAVLDFDDEALADKFRQLYPELAQTRVVRSGKRGLPHFYFHIPQHLRQQGKGIRSRSAPGVDWQYNGRYVIAPPTPTASGASWVTANDCAPKILSEDDLSRIMAFLDAASHTHPKNGSSGVSARLCPTHANVVAASDNTTSQDQLVSYYLARVAHGRNNALFETCCWLRDCGGTAADAAPLVPVHVRQPPPAGHSTESAEKRRGEALRTIASAFSRPSTARIGAKFSKVPNSLREAMLRHKQTALLRVLESLVTAGWRAGRLFTRDEVLRLVGQSGIGDWSLRKALSAVIPNDPNTFVFPGAANAAIAATKTGAETPQLNAIELSTSKPTQNRGRPPKQYQMPDLRTLCASYGVGWSGGDVLPEAALRSASSYRQALHSAMLRRSPGQYYKGWLANRLGISKRTLNRYNRSLGVIVTPLYRERRITWKTLGAIPVDLSGYQYGAFLEDDAGKRYPPLVPIARRLLRRKVRFVYKQQLPNHYRMPLELPSADAHFAAMPPAQEQPAPTFAFSGNSTAQHASPSPLTPPTNEAPSSVMAAPAQRYFVAAGAEQANATAAEQLVDACRGMLSQQRAQGLVQVYGRFAVQDVLHTLQERGERVANPAGFVTSLLKSRYGKAITNGLSSDDVHLAESLYLTAEWHSAKHRLRWQTCCALVREHGQQAVQDVLTELNQYEQGELKNAAGYIITALKNGGQTVVKSPETAQQAATALVETTRQRNRERAFAQSKAKELVQIYGVNAITRALRVVQARTNAENPAGFIIVFLQSEYPHAKAAVK